MVFALPAGEASPQEDSQGWVPGELEAAGKGTQVPCVDGEPLGDSEVQVPLALGGIALQAAVAGIFLTAGDVSSRRRVAAAGTVGP